MAKSNIDVNIEARLVAENRRLKRALDGAGYQIDDLYKEIAKLGAINDELVKALELAEQLDHRDDCPECEGEDEPERCGICCLVADDARQKRRAALAGAAKGAT